MGLYPLCFAVSLFLVVVPAGLPAQVIRGRLVDRARGAPIPSASVLLSDTSGRVLANALTDDAGTFEVTARGAGVYRLAFKRIGYQGRELVLDVAANAVVRVPEDASSLDPLPVTLEEATVTGARHRRLERAGFYERREEGHGSFITREEFEIMRPSQTTDVLRRLRGIRLRPNGKYGAGDTRRYIVETGRGGGAMSAKGSCPTQYFLDGVFIGTAADAQIDLDMTIRVHDIEAIEVYAGAGQLPAKFNIMGGLCGAILIWTQ